MNASFNLLPAATPCNGPTIGCSHQYETCTSRSPACKDDRASGEVPKGKLSQGTSSSFSYRSCEQAIPESFIQREALDLLKNQLSKDWVKVATTLDFPLNTIQSIHDRFIGCDESKHLELRYTEPGYVELTVHLVELAKENGHSFDSIIQAIKQVIGTNRFFGKTAFLLSDLLVEANNIHSGQLSASYDLSSKEKWESYIFLIWVKNPDDPNADALPNTPDRPVQQKAIDWARCNPNKLVVLWYSSTPLNYGNGGGIERIKDYRQSIYEIGLNNLLVLDVDHVEWSPSIEPSFPYDQLLTFQDCLLQTRRKFCPAFSHVIDNLRISLLSQGSSAITSASLKGEINLKQEKIPRRGACFDIDYIPIMFKTYQHPYKPLCRDGSFDRPHYRDGVKRIQDSNAITCSMLAATNEKTPILTDQFLRLLTFTALTQIGEEKPYLCSTTHTFRMTDVLYTHSGKMTSWNRENTLQTCDTSGKNSTLMIHKQKMPEYLARYRTSQESHNDPMLPEV